ncbi:MAG TPA: hypothetical protein VK575_11760 [Gemmatimonadaceae bacterium]|nr:hypothetical protein [Gemmatimonadaceae bacterium]
MMSFSAWSGVAKVMSQLAKIQKNAPDEFGNALIGVAEEVVDQNIIPATPILSGDLRNDIRVLGFFRRGRVIAVKIAAGNTPPVDEYAAIVHEDLELNHPVGGAKYIERPLKAVAPQLPARIAKRINLNKAKDA